MNMSMINHKEQILEQKIQEIEKTIPEKIDTSQFKPLSSQELNEILGLTIKKDAVSYTHLTLPTILLV